MDTSREGDFLSCSPMQRHPLQTRRSVGSRPIRRTILFKKILASLAILLAVAVCRAPVSAAPTFVQYCGETSLSGTSPTCALGSLTGSNDALFLVGVFNSACTVSYQGIPVDAITQSLTCFGSGMGGVGPYAGTSMNAVVLGGSAPNSMSAVEASGVGSLDAKSSHYNASNTQTCATGSATATKAGDAVFVWGAYSASITDTFVSFTTSPATTQTVNSTPGSGGSPGTGIAFSVLNSATSISATVTLTGGNTSGWSCGIDLFFVSSPATSVCYQGGETGYNMIQEVAYDPRKRICPFKYPKDDLDLKLFQKLAS